MEGMITNLLHPLELILSFALGALYLVALQSLGHVCMRFFKFPPDLKFKSVYSFVFGSIVVSLAVLVLGMTNNISILWLTFITFLLGICLFREGDNFRAIVKSKTQEFRRMSKSYRAFLIFFLVLFCVGALTPVRDDDSMRYHLAQIKEFYDYGSIVFRPYTHFNFPMSFNLLFLPIYPFSDIAIKAFVMCCGILFLTVAFNELSKLLIGEEKTKLSQALFLSSPIFLLQATTVNNDFGVLLFSYGALLALWEYISDGRFSYLVIGLLSFAMAVSSKYMALFFGPWVGVLAVYGLWTHRKQVRGGQFAILALGTILLASPYYLRNIYYLSNPFWPGMVDAFSSGNAFIDQVAREFSFSQTGPKGLIYSLKGFLSLLKFPYVPFLFWSGALVYLFKRRAKLFWNVGFVLFLISWGVMQPRYYPRFLFYVFPIMVIFTTELFYAQKGVLAKVARAGLALYLTLCCVIGLWYSKDGLLFIATNNLPRYHASTWFYNEFIDLNKRAGPEDKVLFVVRSDPSYYLNIPHVSANPSLAAGLDWSSVETSKALLEYLKAQHFTYIFYTPFLEETSIYTKKAKMLLDELISKNMVETIYRKNVEIVTRRVTGEKGTVVAYLLKLKEL